MPVNCIDYFELKAVWVRGCRNGNIQKLNPIERGFFRACLTYTKINGPIISKKIIEMIRSLTDILTMTPRREALKQGFEKVKTLIKNNNLIGMFPKILDWVRSLDYILYLGFMEINKPEYMKVY